MAYETSKGETSESMLERVERSVGTIHVWRGHSQIDPKHPEAGEQTRMVKMGSGSGFFINKKGHFLTNKHCVRGSIFTIEVTPGKHLKARVIYEDPARDIAVLQIEGGEFEPLELADSSTLRKGQPVWTMGTPHGMKDRVSQGIVSGTPSVVEGDIFGKKDDKEDGPVSHFDERQTYIDTDADIHSGNSGGPLLDAEGRVIGINVAVEKTFAGGLGFAIPVNEIKTLAKHVEVFAVISTLMQLVDFEKHAQDMRLAEAFPRAVQYILEVLDLGTLTEEDRVAIMADKGIRRLFQEMLTHPSTNKEAYAAQYQAAFGVALYVEGKPEEKDVVGEVGGSTESE